MTLETLALLNDEQASRLLARAVMSTLPDPLAEEAAEPDAQVEAVIAEVRAALRLKDGDDSLKAFSAIRSELARLISEQVLSADTKQAAINRASAAGRLGAGSYQISFSDRFDEIFRPLGVRRSTAEKAVRDADVFCHIVANGSDENTDPVLSLFVKRMPAKGILPNHHILIHAGRMGADLKIDAAWWVYDAPTSARGPIDFLRSFTDRFGERVEIGGQMGTLIFDQPYLLPFEDEPTDGLNLDGVKGARGWGMSRISWDKDKKVAVVQLAYAVDTQSYQQSLRRLGAI